MSETPEEKKRREDAEETARRHREQADEDARRAAQNANDMITTYVMNSIVFDTTVFN